MTRISEAEYARILRANPDVRAQDAAPCRRAAIPAQMGSDSLAEEFEALWALLGGPQLEHEYRFHPERKWRFDYAAPAVWIAVEIDGGLFTQGRHVRPLGFRSDVEKLNAAQLLGWKVFRLTTGQVTAENLQPIIDFMRGKHDGE